MCGGIKGRSRHRKKQGIGLLSLANTKSHRYYKQDLGLEAIVLLSDVDSENLT